MSVLYKALARAAKAREALAASPTPVPHIIQPGRYGRRRTGLRKVLLATAGSLAILLGAFVMFGDDMLSWLDQLSRDTPTVPQPTPLRKRPLPSMAQAPVQPSPTAAEPTRAAPAGLPAAAPLPAVTSAALPPAASAPPAVAPEPSGSVPAASPPPAASIAAASPAALPPPVQHSESAPAQPPAPPPAQAAPAPAAPAPPPSAGPARTAAAPMPSLPAPPRAPAVSPDDDLPAILDNIRRQKGRAVISDRATVARGSAGDLRGPDGDPSISVSVRTTPEADEAGSAYDLLLRGQYEAALTLYDKALRQGPPSVPALLGKATAEHKLRRLAEARRTYRRVLSLDPDNQAAIANMTAIVADQAPAQALNELRALQRAHPAFSPIPAQIAAIENAEGNTPGAVAALNAAVALSPDNGLYRLNLAILQDKMGMKVEATASYQAAVNLLGEGSSLPVPLEDVRRRLKYLQGR